MKKESIKGIYTGDCKKGKANGKGKSIGVDSYEGEFKAGLPDGKGTYIYQNEDVYTGNFLKGLREGIGEMKIKRPQAEDSIVSGFWKKDNYVGLHENPWEIHSRSGSIREVRVEYTTNNTNRVRVVVTNTTGGVNTTSGFSLPAYTVTNTTVITGSYERVTSLETHLKAAETTFLEVGFPFRVKLSLVSEEIDIEFFEKGSYSVFIYINK